MIDNIIMKNKNENKNENINKIINDIQNNLDDDLIKELKIIIKNYNKEKRNIKMKNLSDSPSNILSFD